MVLQRVVPELAVAAGAVVGAQDAAVVHAHRVAAVDGVAVARHLVAGAVVDGVEHRGAVLAARELQRRLYVAAKRSRKRRFHALYDRIAARDGAGAQALVDQHIRGFFGTMTGLFPDR